MTLRKPPPMLAPELNEALDSIGWNTVAFAERVQRSRSHVYRMREGIRTVPPDVADFVRRVRRHMARLVYTPPPGGVQPDD